METTREEWLKQGVDWILNWSGGSLPGGAAVSAGYAPKGRRIGVLGTTVFDEITGHPHVFISPEIRETSVAWSTLTHELAHAMTGKDQPHHGKAFGIHAASLGLLPPWETTPTHVPSLDDELRRFIQAHGEYPADKLTAVKRSKNRMIAWSCKLLGSDANGKAEYCCTVWHSPKIIYLFCTVCGEEMKPYPKTEEEEPVKAEGDE